MELGDCHTSVGDYHEAQQCYEKAAILCPDEAGPYVGLGVVALQKNLIDDALTAFKVACRLDNKSAKAYAGLGMVAQQSRDYKRAFDMFLKSLEMDTNNMISLLGLFQTSCQMGSFEKVTYYLQTYLSMHPGDISVERLFAAREEMKEVLHLVQVARPGVEQSRDVLARALVVVAHQPHDGQVGAQVGREVAVTRAIRVGGVAVKTLAELA